MRPQKRQREEENVKEEVKATAAVVVADVDRCTTAVKAASTGAPASKKQRKEPLTSPRLSKRVNQGRVTPKNAAAEQPLSSSEQTDSSIAPPTTLQREGKTQTRKASISTRSTDAALTDDKESTVSQTEGNMETVVAESPSSREATFTSAAIQDTAPSDLTKEVNGDDVPQLDSSHERSSGTADASTKALKQPNYNKKGGTINTRDRRTVNHGGDGTAQTLSALNGTNSKNNFNFAGVPLDMLNGVGPNANDLVFVRRTHRRRKYPMMDESHPVFAAHRELREKFVAAAHEAASTGKPIPYNPALYPQLSVFATEADVVRSLTEWTDSPSLVYAQALWKYAPETFLRYVMNAPPSK